MKIIVNMQRDSEKVLIDNIANYFNKEIKFSQIYKKQGNVNVSGVHPMAYLVNKQVNGAAIDIKLFPSVTIIGENNSHNPDINILDNMSDVIFDATELADIKNNPDKYFIAEEDYNQLAEILKTNPEIYGQGGQSYRRENIAIEIWSENKIVKDNLFSAMLNFLCGKNRFTLKEEYDINIHRHTVAGERSGIYNFDFGGILFGAIIRFQLDSYIAQYILDTSCGIVEGIDHYEQNIRR